MGLTNFPHGITSMGVPILGSGQDISGKTWFVDGNMGSDGNTGESWDKAFKTLAKAFAVSHADIADGSQKHWARRNTIYIAGDTFTETLAAFPQKTDVIGVGSYDGQTRAGITGHHAPVNSAIGTRFYNIHWKATATASPIITLASDSSGIEFYDCVFDGVVGTVTTGITATASTFLTVKDCEFWGAFATSAISIGTGAMVYCKIEGNKIVGSAGTGIVANASTTVAYGGFICNNFIQSTGVGINDASSKFWVYNNRVITAGAQGTAGAGAIVAGAKMMLDNRISASDVANAIVPAEGSLA
ncbi:MAG: hypothetical protein PHT95_04510 [Candidatus Omnitrophica bacterium]|nr:hypothetical protein [Candidatus Omnitrophota bacterium]